MIRESSVAASFGRMYARAVDRKRRKLEQAHRLDFEAFYARLPRDRPPFYMFFTSGLLHWVVKTLEFVPRDVHVVLLGAGLTPDEVTYLKAYVPRPSHPISLRVWDSTVWEWLFEVNQTDFGWLDVDCLVLNPTLFDQMSRVDDEVALSGCWSTHQGWSFLATYFLFVNHRALCDVKARVKDVSPRMYNLWWHPSVRGAHADLLDEKDRALVRQMGSPKVSFDTTQFYQMAARACGYSLRAVRPLKNDPAFGEFCSEELLHVTGVSWYMSHYLRETSPFTHELVMRAATDYLLLRDSDPRLPASYAAAKQRLERMLGGNPCDMRTHVHDFLAKKGFTERAFLTPGLGFLLYEPAGILV